MIKHTITRYLSDDFGDLFLFEESSPPLIDDFGDEVAFDDYSGKLLKVSEAILRPSPMPGIKGQKVLSQETLQEHRLNLFLFQQSDANCNTCTEFRRGAHGKNRLGLINGTCCIDGSEIALHPEDPMLKPCHNQRAIQGVAWIDGKPSFQ